MLDSVEDTPQNMAPSSVPPPLDEPLKTYFAVQIRPSETPINVVSAIMVTAKSLGILFRRLEVLDTMTLGSVAYVRMRTELTNPCPILEKLFSEGRSTVSATQGGYTACLPGGRFGKVPQLTMHAIPKLGQSRMFRGPKYRFWERQFEAA
jgi:hypothetical protein